MAKSDKDEVVETSGQANSGGSPSSPSSFGATAKSDTSSADGSKDPSAGGSAPEEPVVVDADLIEEVEGAFADSSTQESTDELVAKARAEAQEWQDKFVRLHAEWDTYRRRIADQRAEEKANATERLVEHLLPVIDDFERTIDYAEKNGEKGLLDGVKAVQAKLVDTLVKEGVEVLNPTGEAFDALKCQAISTVDDKTVPDETVADVYQKGYKMGKKVLRPAMVTVATGGPKREDPQEQ